MQLIEKIDSIIADRHLLKTRFYQAWSNGELNRDILQHYALQYAHQVGTFSQFLSLTHAGCDVLAARKVLVENLADEEIHGTDHITLWDQFSEGLGATYRDDGRSTPIPETKAMVDTFFDLAKRDWRDGLCALYTYESQVPAVSASKIAGLKQFYGIDDERTLAFFTAHQIYDVEHARKVGELIERYVEPARAEQATKEAADALCGFLDGMCRVSGINDGMHAC